MVVLNEWFAATGSIRAPCVAGREPVAQLVEQRPFSTQNQARIAARSASEDGDPGAARTRDPLIKSQMLYQLSYGIIVRFMTFRTRLTQATDSELSI